MVLKMFHLNYRWLSAYCGMTEVRVIGQMWMTHNVASISAATHPEIGATYSILNVVTPVVFITD